MVMRPVGFPQISMTDPPPHQLCTPGHARGTRPPKRPNGFGGVRCFRGTMPAAMRRLALTFAAAVSLLTMIAVVLIAVLSYRVEYQLQWVRSGLSDWSSSLQTS